MAKAIANKDVLYLQQQVQKNEQENGRQRWNSRGAFIVAAVGSAVGLGNLWRFPYLSYKYGGGVFFIPYFICLFAIGIPMLLLELTIGQTFQMGDVGAFGGFHPRAQGIGFVSIFCGFMIVCYYNVIIAWAVIYFILSFMHPLWWAESQDYTSIDDSDCGEADTCACQGTGVGSVDTFYKVVGIFDFDCNETDPVKSTYVCWTTWAAVIFVWIVIYLCIFKGVKLTSRIVWFTVLAPVFLLFVLFWAGVTLPGAGRGIEAYIGEWIWSDLSDGQMWNVAAGQIFFTLSVCMGVMTSYGSYNKMRKPVTTDNFIIAICNTSVSIFAGFVVFSVLGYEAKRQGVGVDEVAGSSMGLSFITMPKALSRIDGQQFWCIIFFGTLVTLGIDSAFSLLEAVTTVIHDTKIGDKYSREVVAGVLCVIGVFISLMYCADIGLFLLDTIDHYINSYTMQIVGIVQCVAATWVYGFKKACEEVGTESATWFVASFWTGVFIWAALSIGLVDALDVKRPGGVGGEAAIGWVIGMFFLCVGWTVSYVKSNKPPGEWFSALFLYGANSMTEHMAILDSEQTPEDNPDERIGKGVGNAKHCWYWVFCLWWQLSIKYFIPVALLFLLLIIFHADIDTPYEGYPKGYQALGFTVVAFTLVVGALFLHPKISILKDDAPSSGVPKEMDEESKEISLPTNTTSLQ